MKWDEIKPSSQTRYFCSTAKTVQRTKTSKCASLDRLKQDEWNLTRLGKYFYNSKVKTLHAQSHDGNLMIAGKILIWLNGQRQLMPKVF